MPSENADIFTLAMFGSLDKFKAKLDLTHINDTVEGGSSNLLQIALAGGHEDIALFLIDNGIDVNHKNEEGSTALHIACEKHFYKAAESLLLHGCDVNIRNRYGNNTLWTAVFNCRRKYYDIVRLLMTYSPDTETKNKAGRSPIDFAVQIGDNEIIRILKGE